MPNISQIKIENVTYDLKDNGCRTSVNTLRNAVDYVNNEASITPTAFEGTLDANGASVEYSSGNIKVYGTVGSASRYLLCFNDEVKIKSSNQPFERSLLPGCYMVHIRAFGNAPSGYIPRMVYSPVKFNESITVVTDGGLITVNEPIMIAFQAVSNTNYGTSSDPTYLELSITEYTKKLSIDDGADKELLADGAAATGISQQTAYTGENVLNYQTITPNKMLRISSGDLVDTEERSVSDYIPVSSGTKIRMNFYIDSTSYGTVFYDASKRYISGVTSTAGHINIVDIPEKAAFMRTTIPNDMLVSGSETAVVRLSTDWYEDNFVTRTIVFNSNAINFDTITANKRIAIANGAITDNSTLSITDYIPVVPGMRVELNNSIGSTSYGTALYNKSMQFQSGVPSNAANRIFTIPNGVYYIRLTLRNEWLVSGSETAEAKCFWEQKPIIEKTKWLALGDSITYGVYSTGPDTKVDDTYGWVWRLAHALDYELNNQGVRGMGFIAAGGNDIHWSDILNTVDALTDDYNLITVALGINDYNTSSVTLEQISAAVDNGIQRIMAKFPQARLVFITPFNSNRRGDASTNYCYNYENGGKTLKNVADTIKERCALYGVECIYATNGFLLNNYNMATLLPDLTHPSDYCHTLIAKNMAHFLLN